MPYAEADGISFFGIGDWMAQYDKPMWQLVGYYRWRYGDYGNNPAYPGTLWYPPPFHTNMALVQILGGERIIPIFIFFAMTDALIVISVYFLLRKIYNFWSASIASFLLIFSLRDYITNLWGQWSTLISFSFIPVILYCYYKYTSHYIEGNRSKIYGIMLVLLMVSQYLLHPVGSFNSIVFIGVYTVLLFIKLRKLPFSLKDAAGMILLFTTLIFILAPFIFFNIFTRSVSTTDSGPKIFQFSNLFHFSIPFEDAGYPPFWFDFTQTIGPWYVVPFLIIGIIFLLIRRKKEDLLILSWLIGLYIFLQFLAYYNAGRYIRNVIEIAHVFYAVIAIGIVYLFSFIKVPYKEYVRYGLIIIFVILIITSTGTAAYQNLRGAYAHPFQRLNPSQYEAAEWIKQNTKMDDEVFDTFSFLISRDLNTVIWLQVIAQRQIRGVKLPWQNNNESGLEDVCNHDATYALMDSSRLVMANAQAEINKMQGWEQKNLNNETLIYNKDNIRIYRLTDVKSNNKIRNNTCNYHGIDTTKFTRLKIFGII
jgi:hypothetical protein